MIRGRLEASSLELVTVKTRAEAQVGVHAEQAERVPRMETELTQARGVVAGAREAAAKFAGQAEALTLGRRQTLQQAELRRVRGTRGRAAGAEGGKEYIS